MEMTIDQSTYEYEQQLKKIESFGSWTDFTRRDGLGSSAAKISEALKPGTFVEINDNKFQGHPVVILVKEDYEKLVKNSRTSLRARSVFVAIKQVLKPLRDILSKSADNSGAMHIQSSVETTIQLGLDLVKDIQPIHSSKEEYLSSEESGNENEGEVIIPGLPQSRADLDNGVAVEK